MQKKLDSEGQHLMAVVKHDDEPDDTVQEEEDLYKHMIAYDDVSGEPLDPRCVADARQEEFQYFRSMGVYKKVDIAECYAKTKKKPIQCRWIDINTGDTKCPKYRSRLVAKPFASEKGRRPFCSDPT